MTKDLNTISSSLQLLDEEKSTRLLDLSYSCFFKACPEAESLWEKDDPVSRTKMFNGVVLTVLDQLSRPEIGKNNLIADIKDHDGYGVSKEMYRIFFQALLQALKTTLGDAFDQNMEQAWMRQLDAISEIVNCHANG